MGNSESKNIDNLNIILIGKTGVGKSTLINNIFDENWAQEGAGFPCTHKIDPYSKENSHLTLYDTPSFGINSSFFSTFKDEILNIINEKSKTKDINKIIHCIWYCVDSNANKIDELEKKFISIFKNIPIIIVLTKSVDLEKTNELMRQLEFLKMNIKYVVPVLAKKIGNEEPFGINNLIYFTTNSLSSNVKATCSYNYLNFKNHDESTKIQNIEPFKKNVLVLGMKSAGKSTLINSILGEKKAETGLGVSKSNKIDDYDSVTSPYHFFDTPGYQLNTKQHTQLKKDILDLINERGETNDIKQFIHCIWYCMKCESKTIDDSEIKLINELYSEVKMKNIPIILVLTQCYDEDVTKKMINIINDCQINFTRISPIIAEEEDLSDFEPQNIVKPFGIEELISFTNYFISDNFGIINSVDFFGSKLEDEIKNLLKINIIVMGEQLSGKKTLMKRYLGENLADSMNNAPIFNDYENDDCCFHFYHFDSYEENQIQQVKLRENIIKLINDKHKTKNFQKMIHCLWFCVKCKSEDINEDEIDCINILSNELKPYKIPVILVITQCVDQNIKDQMINKINNNYPNIKYIHPILAENFNKNSKTLIEAFGIDDLVGLTNSALANSFISDSINDKIAKSLEDTNNNLNKINIIAIGKAGVGKSTLINNFFRGHLAATGIGRPVTQRITPLTTPNNPLTIYDTPGFELDPSQHKELQKDILKLIENGYKTKDINKYIHCILYCISTESYRFEETEKLFIQKLTKVTNMYQVPVFIILTQSYRKTIALKMKESIEAEKLSVVKIIPVVAQIKKMGGSVCKPFGMEELTEAMGNELPEALKITFSNVQIASISYKRKCAAGAIGGFVAGSAAIGASPIPFSDCFLLAGLEIAMFSAITAIYNVDVSHGFISTVLSCLIGCASASLIGRTIVVNLIKFIPFAGSIVGAVAGGITGGVLTGAFGGTYMLIMEAVLKGEIDPKKISKSELKAYITPIFNAKLEEEKEKNEKEKNKNDENEKEEIAG